MENLQDIIQNYHLVQPAIASAGGSVIGAGARFFQNYLNNNNPDKPMWNPGGSLAAAAIYTLYLASSSPGIEDKTLYLTIPCAALAFDYISKNIVDALMSKKSQTHHAELI